MAEDKVSPVAAVEEALGEQEAALSPEEPEGPEGPQMLTPEKLRRIKRRTSRGGGDLLEAPENWVLSGFLKKGEWKAPTRCCIPIRERQFKDKFVAIDMSEGAMAYSKTRKMLLNVAAKKIPFAAIKSVALESESSKTFLVYVKSRYQEEFKGREFFSWMAIDSETAQAWVAQLREVIFLRATVYGMGPNQTFPETELGVVPHSAVCFSGGGVRSFSATVGHMRALHILQLLNNEDISYMSTVSGSAWAGAIFNFYTEGAKDDSHLLGGRTRMDDCDLYTLKNKTAPILEPASQDMWKLAETIFWTTNSHEWWERTVAEIYLKPFGLDVEKSFAHRDLERVIESQNHLLKDRVLYSHRGRPFWVANAAVIGPKWARAGDMFPVQFTPMYSGTPFPHKMHLRGLRHGSEHKDVKVGGGMIDSFAFGTDAPSASSTMGVHRIRSPIKDSVAAVSGAVTTISNAASEMVKDVFSTMESLVTDHPEVLHKGVPKRYVRVPMPELPLTLRHAVGIASHAPAFIFKNSRYLEKFNPRAKFWSEVEDRHLREDGTKEHKTHAHEMDFADGGTLDNIGLLSMLQRKLRRIVVFVNSEIPIPLHPKKGNRKSRPTSVRKSVRKVVRSSRRYGDDEGQDEEEEGDSVFYEETYYEGVEPFLPEYHDWPQASILPLFGVEVPVKSEFGTFAHNQVFKKKKIIELLEQLQILKVEDEPLIVQQELEVLRNDWWGIKGGTEVEIMWVYLEKCRLFELQLPRETLDEIDKGKKGLFPRFPLFKTFGQKKGKIIEPALLREQANLLAAQAEWTVLNNAQKFKSFLRDLEAEAKEQEEELIEGLHEKGFT